ncbi:MAG TPA: Uma2 family endonuclease [Thermoanaerobaculia bacterium]
MTEPAYKIDFPGQDWPAQGHWTYEDYLRLPKDGRRYEVIRGHLYVTAAPNFDHQFAVTQLGRLFGNFLDGRALGTVLVAPFEILLPRGIADPVQPDLLFFRIGNGPQPGAGSFEGVPDLVVEVLSPRTRRRDEKVKLAAYRDAGVPEVWLADPQRRNVVVHGFDDNGRFIELARAGAGEIVASRLLSGLRIAIDQIFPQPL